MFLIPTSFRGTGAKPNIYFPDNVLQASTSILMQVEKAGGQGGVGEEGREGNGSGAVDSSFAVEDPVG